VGPTSNTYTNRQQPIENNSVTTSFSHFFAHNSLTSSILRVSLTIGQLGNRKKNSAQLSGQCWWKDRSAEKGLRRRRLTHLGQLHFPRGTTFRGGLRQPR